MPSKFQYGKNTIQKSDYSFESQQKAMVAGFEPAWMNPHE